MARLITHNYKFGEKAEKLWEKIQKTFHTTGAADRFLSLSAPTHHDAKTPTSHHSFHREKGLGRRFALGPRNIKWFDKTVVEKIAMHQP
ncbi:MAG: hypothetical protein QXI50_07405 [Candidatus Caldarchaeum sp.]